MLTRRMDAHSFGTSITKLLQRDVRACVIPYVCPCDVIFMVKLLHVIGSRSPFAVRHAL